MASGSRATDMTDADCAAWVGVCDPCIDTLEIPASLAKRPSPLRSEAFVRYDASEHLVDACKGEYGGIGRVLARQFAEKVASAVHAQVVSDVDEDARKYFRSTLYTGVVDRVVDGSARWAPSVRQHYGVFDHVAEFRVNTARSRIEKCLVVIDLDVVFSPRCAGQWGSHRTWRGWVAIAGWNADSAEQLDGVITGLGPAEEFGDGCTLLHPVHTNFASWEEQRLSLALQGLHALSVGDEEGGGSVILPPVHNAALWVGFKEKWGRVLGFRKSTAIWSSVEGTAPFPLKFKGHVLFLDEATMVLTAFQVMVQFSPGGNCVVGLCTGPGVEKLVLSEEERVEGELAPERKVAKEESAALVRAVMQRREEEERELGAGIVQEFAVAKKAVEEKRAAAAKLEASILIPPDISLSVAADTKRLEEGSAGGGGGGEESEIGCDDGVGELRESLVASGVVVGWEEGGSDEVGTGLHVMEDRCDGSYAGYEAEVVKHAAIECYKCILAVYSGDEETASAMLWDGARERVLEHSKEWGSHHRKMFGEIDHAASFRVVTEDTKLPQPLLLELDIVYRPSHPRTAAWGGHCTYRAWWCRNGDTMTGVVSGCGPMVVHKDAARIEQRHSTHGIVPSWRDQQVTLFLQALHFLAEGKNVSALDIVDERLVKIHSETIKRLQGNLGNVIGVEAASVRWDGELPPGHQMHVNVLFAPTTLYGKRGKLHRVPMDVGFNFRAVNAWSIYPPSTPMLEVPLPGEMGGGAEESAKGIITAAHRLTQVYVEKKVVVATEILTVSPGERALGIFYSPVEGHPLTPSVLSTSFTIGDESVEPTCSCIVPRPASGSGTVRLCDGSGGCPELRVYFVRVDNRSSDEPVTVTCSIRAVTGRRRLVADSIARKLPPEHSIVPIPHLTKEEIQSLLAPDAVLDFDTPSFRSWLASQHLLRNSDETALEFLRRAQATLQTRIEYAGQRHTVEHAHNLAEEAPDEKLRMHCHGCSLSLLSILRANHIPCRAIAVHCGLEGLSKMSDPAKPFPSFLPINHIESGHTFVEVFLPGLGFVPVEPQADFTGREQLLGDDVMNACGHGGICSELSSHARLPQPFNKSVMDAMEACGKFEDEEIGYLHIVFSNLAHGLLGHLESPYAVPYAMAGSKGKARLVGLDPSSQAAILNDLKTGKGWEKRVRFGMKTESVLVDNYKVMSLHPLKS